MTEIGTKKPQLPLNTCAFTLHGGRIAGLIYNENSHSGFTSCGRWPY